MSGELDIRVEQQEETILILLNGEVDIYSAQMLKEKLYEVVDTYNKDLKIDCRDLSYIDSTGLGVFVGVLKKEKLNGKTVYLSNLKDNIKKLFIITGLDKLFMII